MTAPRTPDDDTFTVAGIGITKTSKGFIQVALVQSVRPAVGMFVMLTQEEAARLIEALRERVAL